MHPVLKNLIAVVAGILFGSMINMGLILISGSVIPPPAGADVTTTEGLKASMHLFEPKHFLFPFLAHAIGTLSAAFLASKIAASHRQRLALFIGVLFLAGGIAAVRMLPSPLWFTIIDLVLAYVPMAWLGYRLAGKK